MYIDERKQKNGTVSYRFGENYKDPLTGKNKRVSVTSSKNTKAVQKEMQRILNDRINEILTNSVSSKTLTIKTLVD